MNYLYNGNIKLIKSEKTPCAVLIAEVLSDGHHLFNRNRKLIKCIQKTDGAVLMCSCKINNHGRKLYCSNVFDIDKSMQSACPH